MDARCWSTLFLPLVMLWLLKGSQGEQCEGMEAAKGLDVCCFWAEAVI